LIQDAARAPATKTTVDGWNTKYKCQYDIVADPKMQIAPTGGGSIGLPYQMIIDPRTMTITKIIQGDGPSVDSAVTALITKNGG